MGMVVQHNMNAINSYNKLNANVAGMKKSSEKLSSGYRINRAGDDAAGLAVSEKMRSQIKGLNQAIRNSQDGINMIQTYEGAAQETHSILQRMKELASQSANGTYDNSTDRAAIQLEFDQLNDELNQIADTDFNGTVALNGGVMADGTKAAGGAIDYSAAYARDPKQLGGTYINGIGTNGYNFTAPAGNADATSKTVDFTVEVTEAADGTKTYEWTASDGTATSNDNGGFTYDGATIGIDTSNLVSGDSVKITFNKNTDKIAEVSATAGATSEIKGANGSFGTTKGSFAVDTGLTADKLTEELADALNALNGAKITEDVAAADGSITLKTTALSGTGNMDKWAGASFTIDTDGNISYSSTTVTTAVKLGKWTKTATLKNNTVAGTVENTLVIGESTYKAADPGSIKVIEPKGVVSKADSYDNSTAKMTYANSITLQTGARTKDSVNFTFNYNADGTADMGSLKANLNISARADGLNTENLSLATQDDANYAIDQIDKAINKTSMVRATFGSIQNRLEHKITNLTTTSENLTEAESSIRDTDMASEMMNYTKMNILQQAAQSMLAQANQQPQSILQLLG